MIVETPERLTSSLKHYEVLNQPNPGGWIDQDEQVTNYQIETFPRISAPVESQELRKTPPLDFVKDLRGIERINRFFQDGGVIMSEGISNYDLRSAKWAAGEARLAGQVGEFKEYETEQVEKALGERYNVAKDTVTYLIDEYFRFRNDKRADEPAATKIARGNVYLKQKGSPDTEREQKELEGFLKVEALLADPLTPLHTKTMVISPPSALKGSIYKMNYVDFYELVKDEQTGKRVVRMTRFATDATYGEGVTDAYFLSHPTTIDATDARSVHEIFMVMFGSGKNTVKEKDMQAILSKSEERIRFYINALCDPAATAESIAVAFNAVLNGADLLWEGLKTAKEVVVKGIAGVFNSLSVFRSIKEEVDWLGRLPVEQIAAACGMSAGFSVRGLRSIGNFISNISRIFSGRFSSVSIEGVDYQLGSCVVCKKGNVLVGGCDICVSCEPNM